MFLKYDDLDSEQFVIRNAIINHELVEIVKNFNQFGGENDFLSAMKREPDRTIKQNAPLPSGEKSTKNFWTTDRFGVSWQFNLPK